MIVLIVITIGFQLTLNSGYKPLVQYLPLSVANKMADNASGEDGQKNHPTTFSSETPREKDQSSASFPSSFS